MIRQSIYLLLFFAACIGPARAQTPRVVPFSVLDSLMNDTGSTIHVINFWATWCKPCIEELPSFLKMQDAYAQKGVKLVLVSLDSPKKLEDALVPFLRKRKIDPGQVWLLNAGDPNIWIDKVSPEWQGSIPATLLIQGSSGTVSFMSRSLPMTPCNPLFNL